MDLIVAVGISVVILTALSAVLFGSGTSKHHARHRTKALSEIARSRSWSFNRLSDHEHSSTYRPFDVFQRGRDRQCNNTIEGNQKCNNKQLKFKMGDFRSAESTDDGNRLREFSYLCVHLPFTESPDLFIRRSESQLPIPAFTESEQIETESVEFNQAYMVYSSSKRFAFDVITPSVMNAMLDHPVPDLDLRSGIICVQDGSIPWRPDEFLSTFDNVFHLLNFFPEHIIADLEHKII